MSYYKITSSQSEPLVLTMIAWPYQLARFILFVAGVLCLLYYSSADTQSAYSLALGYLLLALVLYLYNQACPHRITFPKNKDYMLVYAKARTMSNKAIQLPYSQLHGIGIRRRNRSGKNQKARYHWEISLEKRDQSLWVLNSFGSVKRAKQYAQDIAQGSNLPIHIYPLDPSSPTQSSSQTDQVDQADQVATIPASSVDQLSTDFKLTYTPIIDQPRSPFIQVVADQEHVIVSWIKPVFLFQRLAHILFCSCFATLSVTLWHEEGMFFTFLAFITALFSLLSLYTLLSKAKANAVIITAEYIEGYAQTGLSQREGRFMNSMHEIGAISSMMSDNQTSGLFVFSKGELKNLIRLQYEIDQAQDVSLSVLLDYARLFIGVRKLDVGSLNFADILELELLIQGYACKLSGIEIG